MHHITLLCLAIVSSVHAIVFDSSYGSHQDLSPHGDDGFRLQLRRKHVPQRYFVNMNENILAQKSSQAEKDGYRLIWLDGYGPPGNTHYAAVWSKSPGVAWVYKAGMNLSDYNRFYKKWAKQNHYVQMTLSVTGPVDNLIYSAIFRNLTEKTKRACYASKDEFQSAVSDLSQSSRLLNFDEFGTPETRQYCATLLDKEPLDRKTVNISQKSSDYFLFMGAETSKPYWRNSLLAVSEDAKITTLYENTFVGGSRTLVDITELFLHQNHEYFKSQGLQMVQLVGRGVGKRTRFAAIWQHLEHPSPRKFRATGNSTGFKDNAAAREKIDNIMEAFMKVSGVRQAQVAIAKFGKVILERAYTFSEPQRTTTKPDDRFLLAGVSGMFLEAAVQSLYDTNVTTPDFQPFKNLKVYPWKGKKVDPRLSDITVQELLDHQAGFNSSESGDPTYDMRHIAQLLNNGTSAVTIADMVTYTRGRPLDFTPRTGAVYSNLGFVIASALVETLTNKSYFNYLRQAVLDTAQGFYNVQEWGSEPTLHQFDRVTQESSYTGLSADSPSDSDLIAAIFSGDGMHKEAAEGSTSLSASASVLARFAHKHNVFGNGSRQEGYARDGSTPGALTWVESYLHNFDWALVANYREFDESIFKNVVNNEIPSFLDSPEAHTK